MLRRTNKIAGKSQYQYWNDLRRKSAKKSMSKPKDIEKLKKQKSAMMQRAHEKMKEKKAPKKIRLDKWFDHWFRHCHTRCEECNEPINKFDPLELRSVQAHILPKKTFDSVCDVIENHATLGVRCGCHYKFDKSWLAASSMKIWPVIIERFKTFEHLIAPEERRKIPDVFFTPSSEGSGTDSLQY
jgi:hypothetical protein